MRPKIVTIIVLAGLIGVAGILLIKHQTSPQPAAAPIAVSETQPAAPQTVSTITNVPPPAFVPVAPSSVAVEPATNALTPEQRQAAIDTEMDNLQDWAMNDDPASLSNILADLTNSVKEVRAAAIEAAEQYGSSNAVPVLRSLAAIEADPKEKAALIEAADFLSLPPLHMVRPTAEQKAQMEAHRRALLQERAQSQDSQSVPPPANGQNPPNVPNNQ